MSFLVLSGQTKKKTVAQLRAEKKRLQDELAEGTQLAKDLGEATFLRFQSGTQSACPEQYAMLDAAMAQANRAYELLSPNHVDIRFFCLLLLLVVGALFFPFNARPPYVYCATKRCIDTRVTTTYLIARSSSYSQQQAPGIGCVAFEADSTCSV